MKMKKVELWFITGSQHLYGEDTLRQVNADSKAIAAALDKSDEIPVKVVFKPVLTTADAITAICLRQTIHRHVPGLLLGCIHSPLQRCGYQGLRG